MKCRVHLAWFTVLIALGTAPVYGASPGSVTGTVRDSSGVPQIGAVVQLLRPDLSLVATVYTNSDGRFEFATVRPGRYALKAMATSFLPSLRENVRVHSTAVVNITLDTLFEAIQWLPSRPRGVGVPPDDWKWTLRSAANRPLLRWLENGPLVMVSDGSGSKPRLKARIMATGAAGTFGENGQRYSAAVMNTPTGSRELLARVDFSPDSTAGMESMLGFDQDLGMAGSVQSVAAISIHPDVGSGDGQGLSAAAVRSSELMRFGPALTAEVGATEILARLGGPAQNSVTAALPYAGIGWSAGDSTIAYRMDTFLPGTRGNSASATEAALPAFSARDGRLLMQHGMHQEIAWNRQTEKSGMAVVLYADDIVNPVLEGMSQFGPAGPLPSAVVNSALLDGSSGLVHAAGPDFSSSGITAGFEHRLPGANRVSMTYATGKALVMPALPARDTLLQAAREARAEQAQAFTLSFSGTLDGTGTKWSASYRWQPESTLTTIAPYAVDAAGPYLNVYLRQPIRLGNGATGFEALIDVGNLLAEGYRPVLLSDGSVVIFAQGRRCIRGGVAFTF